MHIGDIRLGWMMVPRQNSQDVLRLIPVWDFYGYNIVENTHTGETEKEEYLGHSQFAVNAPDSGRQHHQPDYGILKIGKENTSKK